MSDTEARSSTGAAQLLADALLRSVGGTSAQLKVSATGTDSNMSEIGLVPTAFADVLLSPVAFRKMRPKFQEGGQSEWELLVSATSVAEQIGALDLPSAQALFGMALAVTVSGQDYVIESIASNEAFGQVYLYRLLLREARAQGM